MDRVHSHAKSLAAGCTLRESLGTDTTLRQESGDKGCTLRRESGNRVQRKTADLILAM